MWLLKAPNILSSWESIFILISWFFTMVVSGLLKIKSKQIWKFSNQSNRWASSSNWPSSFWSGRSLQIPFPFFLMLLSKSPTWEFIWSMFWNSGRFRFQLSLEIIWLLMKIIDLIVSCNLSLFETLFFSFLLVFCAIAPLLPFISRWWKMAIFSNSVKLP